MKPIMIALTVGALAGCASSPRQLPRATAYDLSVAEDRLVCLAGNLYPKSHVDANNVLLEYQKRLRDGKFTHEQCSQFYAKLQRDKTQSEQESAEAWGAIAYQLGYAIGSRGGRTAPQPYTPSQPATRPAMPPSVPFSVPATSYPLLAKTPDAGASPWFATCSYIGTTTTVKIQMYEYCPATVVK